MPTQQQDAERSPTRSPRGFASAPSSRSFAVFQPLRGRVQRGVNRFNRLRGDAARSFDDFNARLRHQVAVDAVRSDIHPVRHTMHPEPAVWLRQADS